MSEFSRAWSISKLGQGGNQEQRKAYKAAFRAGWEAREVVAHRAMASMTAEQDDIRRRLEGAPDSMLAGENGLAAATMAEVRRLKIESNGARKALALVREALGLPADYPDVLDEITSLRTRPGIAEPVRRVEKGEGS